MVCVRVVVVAEGLGATGVVVPNGTEVGGPTREGAPIISGAGAGGWKVERETNGDVDGVIVPIITRSVLVRGRRNGAASLVALERISLTDGAVSRDGSLRTCSLRAGSLRVRSARAGSPPNAGAGAMI